MKFIKSRTVSSNSATTTLLLSLLFTSQCALADSFNIDISDDDIAIEASNASLKELLQELENLTGIPVEYVAETDEKVTLSVGMTSVENAIAKITPNHMIVHETQNGKNVIKELIIIPAESDLASGGSGSAFLPNGNPAPAIEQSESTEPMTPTDQQLADQPTPEQQPLQPTNEPASQLQPATRVDGQTN